MINYFNINSINSENRKEFLESDYSKMKLLSIPNSSDSPDLCSFILNINENIIIDILLNPKSVWVHDFSSGGIPCSLWYQISFLEYFLNRYYYGITPFNVIVSNGIVKSNKIDVTSDFEFAYDIILDSEHKIINTRVYFDNFKQFKTGKLCLINTFTDSIC
jgi:hypothetical protein